jgi:putative ABC transport system permease protein
MVRNYLLVALRNIRKNLFLTSISVAGLSLGLACVFLIAQYLVFELSYDRFHEGAENIYRIEWFNENPQPRTPYPMAQAMVEDFPEVENAVTISPLWGNGLTRETYSVRSESSDVWHDESNAMAVDSTFFKVFSFPLLKGDPANCLKSINTVLISESFAKKYFGEEDPMGKKLIVNVDRAVVEVGGVFKDVPKASHFHFDLLVSYVREMALDPNNPYYTWADFGHYNYVRLKPGANPAELEGKLLGWAAKKLKVPEEMIKQAVARGDHFELQPITDIHLKSHILWELEPNGYIAYVYMLGAAGFLILVIAIINFINLTTAQSADRSREIGIRKSLGAHRSQLAFQFTGEALIVSMMSVVLAAVVVEWMMPFYTSLSGAPSLNILGVLIGLTALGLLTGVLAGAFPSFRLAAVRPTEILKGKLPSSPEGRGLRQVFITFQFFASMTLICCSAVIVSQLDYMRDRPLGFDQEEVLVLPMKENSMPPRMEVLKEELLKVPGIRMVSAASNIPGTNFNRNPCWNAKNPSNRPAVSEEMIDYDFFRLLGVKLVDGRLFDRRNPADREAFVINEAAAQAMFPEGAVGQEMVWDDDEGEVRGTVIGVVGNFNFQSLHEPVRPLLFRLNDQYNHAMLKMHTDHLDDRMKAVEAVWRKFDNQFAFEFSFLRDELNDQYREERNLSVALTAFSVLAVAIAAFGLLGIAALTFRQKTKEVSIRKVMGATVERIIFMLLKDFTRLVLIAAVISVPVTWWAMSRWLNNFTFHTEVNPLIFLGVGGLLLIVAWVTLGYLTVKVARTNPAETLKGE